MRGAASARSMSKTLQFQAETVSPAAPCSSALCGFMHLYAGEVQPASVMKPWQLTAGGSWNIHLDADAIGAHWQAPTCDGMPDDAPSPGRPLQSRAGALVGCMPRVTMNLKAQEKCTLIFFGF